MLHDLSRREQIDLGLLRRIHDDDDPWAREDLARRCLPLVRSIARRYRDRGEDLDDLVQAGTVGLVKAMDRFDPDGSHRFVSFAVPNIAGEIRRHFRDHTWAVHVPRSLQELDQRVQSATRAVLAETGREPTEDDLAAELRVTVDDVREARAAGRSYRALSTDAPVGEDGRVADLHGAVDPGYAGVEDRALLDEALGALDDRERLVVDLRFGDEGLLQREIAERIGVSQMHVSRILRGAMVRMRERLEEPGASAGPVPVLAA